MRGFSSIFLVVTIFAALAPAPASAGPAHQQVTANGTMTSWAHSLPTDSYGSFNTTEGTTSVVGSTGSCGDDAAGYAQLSATSGALGMSVRASSVGSLTCGSVADCHGNLTYQDLFTVTSSTLPNGTPVTLDFCVRGARTRNLGFHCGGSVNDAVGVTASAQVSFVYGTTSVSAQGSFLDAWNCFDGHFYSATGILDSSSSSGPVDVTLAGVPVGGTVTVSASMSSAGSSASSTTASGLGSLQTLLLFGCASAADVRLVSVSNGEPISGGSSCSDASVALHMPKDPRTTAVPDAGAGAAQATLELVAPNPARAAVQLAFSLSRECAVELAVYDVAGRQVAMLASGRFGAGQHRLTWDGRTAGGARVPAGMYVCRLTADGIPQCRRLLVVR